MYLKGALWTHVHIAAYTVLAFYCHLLIRCDSSVTSFIRLCVHHINKDVAQFVDWIYCHTFHVREAVLQ